MSGWIKLHRDIKNHWIYTEKRKFSKFEAWTDILLSVNHTQAKTIIKGKLIIIERGESILSLDSWANKWGWNKSSVNRFFELLKTDGMILIKNETVTTRLTVCNYASYQDEQNNSETQTKRRRNASETQTKPIKEEQEEEEEQEQEKGQKVTTPSLQDCILFFTENNRIPQEAEAFFNYYESINWKRGKNKITKWKLAAAGWIKRDYNNQNNLFTPQTTVKPVKASLNDE